MNIGTPRISVGLASAGDSRYPVCDQLQPQLEQDGKGWMLELARWYESDWRLALDGGPEPAADSVLQVMDTVRQEELRTVLDSIDTRYATERQRLSGATIDTHVSGRDSEAADKEHPQGTIDSQPAARPPTPADAAVDVTMDSQLPARMSEPDVTMDSHSPAAHSEYAPLEPTLDLPSDAMPLDQTLDASPSNQISGLAGDGLQATVDTAQHKKGYKTTPDASAGRAPKPIPGYQIKGILGRGGMGVVYLAQQKGIDRLVALKMILSGGHADQMMLDRFQAEARAIGRFQHENIVRIYDAGSHDGMPYFSLEYVEGNSLSGYLDGKPIEPLEAAKLVEPMARAMQYAHDAGVIHRDLKPANVLMTKEGVPKITDFGLAKEFETDEQLSMAGSVVGTPAFMAPEQARGESDVGPLADVYGLGAMLYCMITGRPPFQGAKATDTLLQVIRNEPVEPIKLQPGIPKDLETICLKCLQKDRSQRYQGGSELADDLGRFIRGEPISARPISRPERVWRWCKRNPKMATASGLAAVLALIVMIGGPTAAAVIWNQKQEVVVAKNVAQANEKVAKQKEQEAIAAKEKADKSAEAAAVQERNAVDALKSVTYVLMDKLSGQTNLLTLREDLLTTVRNGLKRMERFTNTIRGQNMITVGTHVRMGELYLETGQPAKATKSYEDALAVFQAMENQQREIPNAQQNWSKIYQLLGDAAFAAGALDQAAEHHQRSLQIRRDWATATPNNNSFGMLATSLGKLGSLAQVQGDLTAARKYMDEAVAVRQRLRKENPDSAGAFVELLGAKLVLGKVIFQQGETRTGIDLVTEVTDHMVKYAQGNPDKKSAQQDAAMFQTELATMLLYTGDLTTANSLFNDAVATLDALKAAHPLDARVHEELEQALYGLAVNQELLDQQQAAQQTLDRVTKLRRESVGFDPSNLATKSRLLVTTARAGNLQEGLQLAKDLEASREEGFAVAHYDLACGYAQLARARAQQPPASDGDAADLPSQQELSTAAIEALQAAIEAGFFRATDLKLDPDLTPIRDLPAFGPLVEGRG
jgi:serine/threonine-protein kinase